MPEKSFCPGGSDVAGHDCVAARAFRSVFRIVIESDACVGNSSCGYTARMTALTGGNSCVGELTSRPRLTNIRGDRVTSFTISRSTVGVVKGRSPDGADRTFIDMAGDTSAGCASKISVEDTKRGASRAIAVRDVLHVPRSPSARLSRGRVAAGAVWNRGKGMRHLIFDHILNGRKIWILCMAGDTSRRHRRVSELRLLPSFAHVGRITMASDTVAGSAVGVIK